VSHEVAAGESSHRRLRSFQIAINPMSTTAQAPSTTAAQSGRRTWTAERQRYLLFIALVAPVVILRLVTAAYPIFQTIQLSFTNQDLIARTSEWVGFENYIKLWSDFGVRGSFWFTLVYVVSTSILDLVFGLMIALMLNSVFFGRGFVRTINLIPWAIPTIVAGYMFRWLMDDQFGLIPYWVHQITGQQMAVFIHAGSARITVILVQVWKDACFIAIVLLAGLQGVPQDLYEAAKVDGANSFQRFWSITIPLIAPLLVTMGLFRIIWSLASFDLVYGLTQGGPGVATSVLALRVFQQGILFFKFGFASAIAVVLLVLVAAIGALGLWLYRRTDVAY
jgi:multiple sugar transport system permease protein